MIFNTLLLITDVKLFYATSRKRCTLEHGTISQNILFYITNPTPNLGYIILGHPVYVSSTKYIYIFTTSTFKEWYNFLFINRCSSSCFGGTMAICVPSTAPMTPGKPYLKNLEKKPILKFNECL